MSRGERREVRGKGETVRREKSYRRDSESRGAMSGRKERETERETVR